jgi:DNA-binding CsgD family transcriptional regulator
LLVVTPREPVDVKIEFNEQPRPKHRTLLGQPPGWQDARMEVPDLLTEGRQAFAAQDWAAANESLAALEDLPPDASEALAESRWWLDDHAGAIAAWEDAYTGYLRARQADRAARAAVAIAREYTAALGNPVAANGWIQRAADALPDHQPSAERGWIELAQAERSTALDDVISHALAALNAARTFDDRKLEIHALAALGVGRVQQGRISEGMDHLDAALAAATGGETDDSRVLGDVFCSVVEACTLTADMSRVERWLEVFNAYMERHQHPPLLTFCMVCDVEDQLQKGEWEKAEATLLDALESIRAGTRRARCVHPAALLASIRVSQSRFEEAEDLTVGLEDLPEMAIPRASLFLAKGESAVAVAELHRRLNVVGRDSLLASPMLGALVEAEIAHGDVAAAADAATQLEALADGSERERDRAHASLAAGRVTAATGKDARPSLERALEIYGRLDMPLEAAQTRLEIARAIREAEPALAIEEARVALSTFDRIGAMRDADAAANLLRQLGAAGRTGPKGLERLTKREREILALLAQGLTNAEIASRLFISTKTAEHHVSNVLAKLQVRNRSEAAAYAQRFLTPDAK